MPPAARAAARRRPASFDDRPADFLQIRAAPVVTYEVPCQFCGTPQLFENAERLVDPGTLPAFCSTRCSRDAFHQMIAPALEAGAQLVELDCGCQAVVYSTAGNGSSMPWPLCDKARGQPAYFEHSNEIHRQAIETVRKHGPKT